MTLTRLLLPLLVLTLPMPVLRSVVAPLANTTAESRLHFALERSSPAADSTVHMPTEVRLWFTDVPQSGTTTIRVIDASEKLVEMADVVTDAATPKVFSAKFKTSPGAGRYTVSWRAMGADGHVVKGDFAFAVMAHDELL